ncbi:hypothetical protein F5Y04DRAFT_30831 [Hypomontagnella monticulosa]|nr:hypothetical protein F5Y04DRAFT_30831 [Hypomontagnella monticulosa]
MSTGLGALTATFTPAPECNSVVSGVVYTQTLDDGNTTTYKYHTLGPSETSKCYPPGFAPTDAFYSPAICPSGWSAGCNSIDFIGSLTETRAICCPLGYTCNTDPETAGTWSTLSCSSVCETPISVTVPDVSNQQYKVTVLSHILINAAAVNIRWQRDDFIASSTSLPTSSPTSSTTSPTTSPTTSSSSSPTPVSSASTTNSSPIVTDTSNPSGTQSSLAIGLGVGLGSLLLIVLVAGFVSWWWWRRRTTTKGQGPTNAPMVEPERNTKQPPAELWEQFQQEMQTSSNTHEMFTASNTHEAMGVSLPAELPSQQWSHFRGARANYSGQ